MGVVGISFVNQSYMHEDVISSKVLRRLSHLGVDVVLASSREVVQHLFFKPMILRMKNAFLKLRHVVVGNHLYKCQQSWTGTCSI